MTFGDGYYEEDGPDYDHLLDAGWWASEQTKEVCEAIEALAKAPVYEGCQVANGVSVEFLMRLTLLRSAANLDVPAEMVAEAEAYFAAKSTS